MPKETVTTDEAEKVRRMRALDDPDFLRSFMMLGDGPYAKETNARLEEIAKLLEF